jgi:hypothetical protein
VPFSLILRLGFHSTWWTPGYFGAARDKRQMELDGFRNWLEAMYFTVTMDILE